MDTKFYKEIALSEILVIEASKPNGEGGYAAASAPTSPPDSGYSVPPVRQAPLPGHGRTVRRLRRVTLGAIRDKVNPVFSSEKL